jgi:RHS repeat-associated protein
LNLLSYDLPPMFMMCSASYPSAQRPALISHFTGKERDNETGLDYFGARYLSAAQGRFTSPDSPSYSNQRNPQSWNLYAYSLNNPITFIDPNGHDVVCANDIEQCKNDAAASTGSAEAAKRVTTKTITTKHKFLLIPWTTSETTIQIDGDINSFRALSQNADRLADMVTNNNFKVTVHYDPIAHLDWFNGGIRLEGKSLTRFPDDPNGPSAWIDQRRKPGWEWDPDALAQNPPIPQATTAEEFAHEVLGHLWGTLINNTPARTKRNMRDSITGENGGRKLHPSHGQKDLESHHDYEKMSE